VKFPEKCFGGDWIVTDELLSFRGEGVGAKENDLSASTPFSMHPASSPHPTKKKSFSTE